MAKFNPLNCIQQKPVSESLKKKVRDMEAAYRAAFPTEDDLQIANRIAAELESQLTLAQENAFRMAELQTTIRDRVAGKPPERQIKALLSMIEGSETRQFADFLSVEGAHTTYRAVLDRFAADAYQEFTRRVFTPGQSRRKSRMRNVAREMFGENTGDSGAKAIAKNLRAMDKYIVDTLRKYGAKVNYDPDRQFIVWHNPNTVGKVPFETWMSDILPRLDLSRMRNNATGQPFTREDIVPVLREVYENIRTNGAHSLLPGARHRVPFWQKLDETRFFVWKDHAAWEGYNAKYGFDDPFSALVRYIDTNARNLALITTMGPDPAATLQYMKDLTRKAAAEAARKRGRTSQDMMDVIRLERAFDIRAGTQPTGRVWLAEAGSTFRAVVNSNVLGGTAPMALLSDSITQFHARQFNGLSRVMQLPQFLDAIIRLGVGGPRSAAARKALELGLPLQSIQHSILGSMRALGEFDGTKWGHMLADTNFRLWGLTLVTDAQQASFGTEFMLALTRNLGKDFSRFDSPRLAQALRDYGIDEATWKAISAKAPKLKWNGVDYLDLVGLIRDVDYDNGAKIMNMVHSETNQRAVITSSAATRRRLEQGTEAGTLGGEAMRTSTQLLSWGVTAMFTQLGARALANGLSKPQKVYQIASLTILMSVAGALALQLREVAAGKDPLAWDDPKLWLQAMATGGGFGIAGDFLFSEHYGGTDEFLASKLLGPGFDVASLAIGTPIRAGISAATGGDYNAGADVARLFGYTPLTNGWPIATAWNRIVEDELRRMVDPNAEDYFRRQIRARMRDRQQEYWWPPGESEPARAPDLGL